MVKQKEVNRAQFLGWPEGHADCARSIQPEEIRVDALIIQLTVLFICNARQTGIKPVRIR